MRRSCRSRAETGRSLLDHVALWQDLEDLLGCDAIVFGSADYFSYIAGALKDFFDRTYYPSQGRVTGKPYAAFATGGRGGEKALEIIDRICSSFKFKKAVEGVAAAGVPSSEVLVKCKEAGMNLAKVVSK